MEFDPGGTVWLPFVNFNTTQKFRTLWDKIKTWVSLIMAGVTLCFLLMITRWNAEYPFNVAAWCSDIVDFCIRLHCVAEKDDWKLSFSAPLQVTQCCHCVTIVCRKHKLLSIATINTEKLFLSFLMRQDFSRSCQSDPVSLLGALVQICLMD